MLARTRPCRLADHSLTLALALLSLQSARMARARSAATATLMSSSRRPSPPGQARSPTAADPSVAAEDPRCVLGPALAPLLLLLPFSTHQSNITAADHPSGSRLQVWLWLRRRQVLQVQHEGVDRGHVGLQRRRPWARRRSRRPRRSWRSGRRSRRRECGRRRSARGKVQADALEAEVVRISSCRLTAIVLATL